MISIASPGKSITGLAKTTWLKPFSMASVILLGLLAACQKIPPGPTILPDSIQVLKIYTMQEGMYSVRLSELEKAGLDISEPDHLALSRRSEPQPIWFVGDGENTRLVFYGAPGDSSYTQESVYLLRVDPGSPTLHACQPVENPTSGEASSSYPAESMWEINQVYAPQPAQGDHWFWQKIPAPQSQEFSFTLSGVQAEAASIKVSIWGSTEAPANPDHHLRLGVNDVMLLDQTWDGSGWQVLQADVPAGILKDGENRLTLELPGDTKAPADVLFLDWFEVNYVRASLVQDGRLSFDGTGNWLSFRGLTGPALLFQVSPLSSAACWYSRGEVDMGWSIPTRLNQRYFVVDQNGYREPERMEAVRSEPDLGSALNADYLAIGPEDLLVPLQPLLDLRAKQGLRAVALPVGAIYDQFNDGFPEPVAVQRFLAQAAANWQTKPRFLLLVGDASYDPLGYSASPLTNRLPTFFVNTYYGGQTASDVPFGDLDQDGLPDLAVSRLPAQQAVQISHLVDKILRYERQEPGAAWRMRILAVVDGQDPTFRGDAGAFLTDFYNVYQKEIFTPQAGTKNANDQIEQYLESGYWLVSYFGHGSLNMWGKDRLFNTEDAASLNNQHLPIMVTMTCLNGYFIHPTLESLAEAMIWQPKAGAVAVLAPTSLTLPGDQRFLSDALADALQHQPTLGEAFLAAQRQLPIDQPSIDEVMSTFLLFGDPALILTAVVP